MIQHLISSLSKICAKFLYFCEEELPIQQELPVCLGVFSIISIFCTAYTITVNDDAGLLEYLYYCGLIFAAIFITYPIWFNKFRNKKIIGLLWHFTIFFNIAFINVLFLIFSNFSAIQTTIAGINFIIISILTRWQTTIFICILAIVIAIKFYKFYIGINLFIYSINAIPFQISCILFCIVAMIIALIKPRAEYPNGNISLKHIAHTSMEIQKIEFMRGVMQEYNSPMASIMSLAQSLWLSYKNMSDQERQDIAEDIFINIQKLQIFDSNFTIMSRRAKLAHQMNLEPVLINNLIYERIAVCRKFYENSRIERDFKIKIERDNIIVNADRTYLSKSIDNLIINSIIYCPEGTISIHLTQDTNLKKVCFKISDDGMAIPAIILNNINSLPADLLITKPHYLGERATELILLKHVIEMNKGEVNIESDGVLGVTFKFTMIIDPN